MRSRQQDEDRSRIPEAFACLVVILIPWAFNPSGYFIFLPIKWTLSIIVVGLGVTAAIVSKRVPRSSAAIRWAPLLVATAAATLFSVSPKLSLIGSPGRYMGAVAWLVFAGAFALGTVVGSDPRSSKRVLLFAAASSLAVSLYALAQTAGLDPLAWREGVDLSRARSTFGNAAFLGAYLSLLVPLFLRMGFDSSLQRSSRALLWAAPLFGAAALLATQTRGAWVGAGMGFAVLVVLERRRILARRRLALAVAGAAAAVAVLLAGFTPIGRRVTSIMDIQSGTARGRLIQWDLTLDMIADRPIFGWGPDTYVQAFPPYVSAQFEREVGREVIPDRAHNAALDITSTLGVVGLIAFAFLVASVFVRGLKAVPTAASVGLIAGVASYLVQMLFGFPLAEVDVIFWLLAGMLWTFNSGIHTKVRIPLGFGYMLAVITLALTVWAGRDVVADIILRNGLELEASGSMSSALAELESASSIAPERIQYLQASARFKRRFGEMSGDVRLFRSALGDLEHAMRFSPRSPELQLDRADTFLSWGQIDRQAGGLQRAEKQYRNLLTTDPNSSRVLLKLGVAVIEQGRSKAAETLWLRAYSLAPNSAGAALNLALLYEQTGRLQLALVYYRKVLAVEPDNQTASSGLRRLQT